MKRRELIAFFLAALWPQRATSQQRTAKLVGFLSPWTRSDLKYIKEGMHELGCLEGSDFLIEAQFGDRQYKRLPALAEELVQLNVEVIVAIASRAIRAAQRVTSTILTVTASAGDAIGSNFVAGLASPGGNATGLSNLVADLDTTNVEDTKNIEFLKLFLPGLSRMAVLTNPGSSTRSHASHKFYDAGQEIGVEVVPIDAGSPDEIEHPFAAMKEMRTDAVTIVADTLFFFDVQQIADLAIEYSLSSTLKYREYVETGGSMSYQSRTGEDARPDHSAASLFARADEVIE